MSVELLSAQRRGRPETEIAPFLGLQQLRHFGQDLLTPLRNAFIGLLKLGDIIQRQPDKFLTVRGERFGTCLLYTSPSPRD